MHWPVTSTPAWRALDRAAQLLALPADDTSPVIGTSHVGDPVAAATGWCRYDLGQPGRAAEILRREVSRIPVQASRARARFGARLALALAGCGEVDEACRAVEPVLQACEQIDSATIQLDLRALSRTLNRWHTDPLVRTTRLRLNAALRGPHPAGR